MKTKKLLLAGSHAGSTAIAVIEEIKKRDLNWEIHWVGKRFATEGKDLETLEYKNLSKYGVTFHHLESGKVQTKFTKHTIPSLFKIPLGLFQSFKLVKSLKPDLVLSFGSAAGALVSISSNFLKIPVIIHEQTAAAGRANIISSYFAKKILTSRESSSVYFNKNKIELVGNPINQDILDRSKIERRPRIKTILITGGSRGSTWINNAIKPILPRLLEKYFVIHQTGEEELEKFKEAQKEIPFKNHTKYLPFGQTDPKNMAEVFYKSDMVISRAGANTVWELVSLKRPSILIPIPWTYNDEQTENAKYMENLGLARILVQKELSSQKLLSEIEKLINDYTKVLKATSDLESPDVKASENIVNILEENLSL